MSINYLDLYKSIYKVLEEYHESKKVFLIMETQSQIAYQKYITIITSEKGVRKSGLYGWSSFEKAKEWIEKQREYEKRHLANVEELKKKRKEGAVKFLESLKEGDILEASWGYEAIWYDYYKVIGKQGSFVLLKEMQKNRTMEGCKYGYESHGIVSCADEFLNDDIIKRKADDGFIKINSYTTSHLWDGKAREEANWH